MSARLRDVVDVLRTAYPPELAEPWDAVGLVCGDPQATVQRVLFCVDPVEETVEAAVECGAQLLVSHHPLLLRGVHGVPADDPKGRLIHRLVREGIGLFCAHTNADSADPGVSDALAAALGLTVTGPLAPHSEGARTGLGRICTLPEPEPFGAFVQRVAGGLPATAWGVRGAGDPQRSIGSVAVCGGAGDSHLDTATTAGVDAYVTADLRHHPAGEHRAREEVPGTRVPALVDVAHWASEWPWCRQAADVVAAALPGTVEVLVSTRRTDPWTIHAAGAATDPGRAPE
ncbi:dinuclear metal center YbgI/SA1388 family protein [Halopolyspora algeriensis]|uniref:GTP cyclohydrolase 1 type 2 homolog n=1 Tax=Halopolyspora algeriensis TaxID=1500506 RepID=A0A368VHJ6_9ACTN|nr:Nif3-like dinuclear metal center hexameric protein [Halopolyspora algeriensis]RCW40700.1 dinuclear metal center YbgI/SA1388 family protein [Halopolyspora algeriensis]TQM53377.1 dinuclear metal center YbgI/SA1388 family protein [Halopolyspora algeriensis]